MEEVFIWSRWILLYGLAFLGLWHILGLSPLVVYFSALRRRLQRRSEPRLRVTLQGTLAEHNAGKHQVYQFAKCRYCNPQPTSPAPSESIPGLMTGPPEQLSANLPSTREKPASEGSGD